MDGIAIRCKGCGALFYATNRIEPEDVMDFVKYVRQGHRVYRVDPAVERVEIEACTCSTDKKGYES